MSYLYLLSTDDEDEELAQAELWAMTGCEAQGRSARSPLACDISRSAYVGVCAQSLAQAPDLDGLCEAVRSRELIAEGFAIDVRKLAPRVALASPTIACRLADATAASPNLRHPRARYLVLCRDGDWELLSVVSRTRRGYLDERSRPHNFSQALTARHARALVNMAAAPGDWLLDPCCGVGTCVLEAEAMGVHTVGCDRSVPGAFAAAANVRHMGYPCRLAVADAREVRGAFDAIVIDFPYGHTSHVVDGLYEEILNNLALRAFRLGVVMGRPTEAVFAAAGLEVLRCARVRARRLVRHFYLLRGRRRPADATLLSRHSPVADPPPADRAAVWAQDDSRARGGAQGSSVDATLPHERRK